ncbi:MAG: YjbQ family protein [Anaerolineae bacterium]|nr:YjbQ family protein [Anaerolineae bacterium]
MQAEPCNQLADAGFEAGQHHAAVARTRPPADRIRLKHSHVRAALVGPSVTVPFSGSRLDVGTWQRIVCIDFDDRPRSRRVIVQVLGV